MTSYACLLRAVNVGSTGKLPMAELRAMCEAAGFTDVRTYIASGNVVLRSASIARQVQATLEAALARYVGKPVAVLVRTAAEMSAIRDANPFPNAVPNRNVVIFLDQPPPPDALASVSGRDGEELVLGTREIHVHYVHGVGDSRLKLPAAKSGTARNITTVAKLVEMLGG